MDFERPYRQEADMADCLRARRVCATPPDIVSGRTYAREYGLYAEAGGTILKDGWKGGIRQGKNTKEEKKHGK